MIRPTDSDVKAYLEECGVNNPTTERARQARQQIGDMLRTVSVGTLVAALNSRGISDISNTHQPRDPAAIPLCRAQWGPLTCFLADGHWPEVEHRYGPADLDAPVEITEAGRELVDDDPEPVFVIKAHDDVAVDAVTRYRDSCVARGLYRQAAEVQDALREIKAWRSRNPVRTKAPDHTHVPARNV